MEDRPKRLKAAIFPYDNVDISSLLNELITNELIVRYEVDGKHYIWIPNFLLHQRPHQNETDSIIPPCELELEMVRNGAIKPEEGEPKNAAGRQNNAEPCQCKEPSTCPQGNTDLLPRCEALATKVESTCDHGNKHFALENLRTGELENTNTRPLPEPGTGASAPSASANDCPHEAIIGLYHEILPMLPRVKVWNDSRRSMLRTRWREDKARQNLAWWRQYFETVAASDFLCGRCPPGKSRRPFMADLEWLIRPGNMPNVLEGRYKNRGSTLPSSTPKPQASRGEEPMTYENCGEVWEWAPWPEDGEPDKAVS
ncbi:hypothetical protein [Cloacibacillus sp. An23]|uniref:hypothetical protein n=1 Tax=Cloacibacillus sp. An23 TaxID=1965591 RepID=UPI000B57F697|nr:hypothetical protein [Cloacibacillus sp. An23]OUO94773.1 hypothetical protein B5F39_02580 [Cloacibacillus sp. An23]